MCRVAADGGQGCAASSQAGRFERIWRPVARVGRNAEAFAGLPFETQEASMTEKKGHGSATAKKANAKASREGKSNPRTSSSAQAELGKKGGKSK
ncbi:hypothetical protein GCM10008965_56900 [Methylorubrum aminovorans]|nr:hypothetical protein GCM10025880_31100 [Methylorubrum aminovorans]